MDNYYIDRTKAINALNEAQIEFDENYKGLGEAKKIIDSLPIVDVNNLIIDELEKIKEKILTQNPKFTIGCEMKMCLEIIDNHISELKGENN